MQCFGKMGAHNGDNDRSEKAPPTEEGKADRLFVYSRTERETYRVLRSRDDRIEMGELGNLRDGQPIQGEVVKLSPIEGRDNLYDVEVLHEGPKGRAGGRPAQVANAEYRRNWDAIFGKSDVDPSAAN